MPIIFLFRKIPVAGRGERESLFGCYSAAVNLILEKKPNTQTVRAHWKRSSLSVLLNACNNKTATLWQHARFRRCQTVVCSCNVYIYLIT